MPKAIIFSPYIEKPRVLIILVLGPGGSGGFRINAVSERRAGSNKVVKTIPLSIPQPDPPSGGGGSHGSSFGGRGDGLGEAPLAPVFGSVTVDENEAQRPQAPCSGPAPQNCLVPPSTN